MLDQPAQTRRISAEITERDALRTAEAWLHQHEQDARLSLVKPRPQAWDWVLVLEEARNFILAVAALGAVCYGLLSIGGM